MVPIPAPMTFAADPSGSTMLGSGPEFYNNMEAPDNFVGFGGSPGPEYYNNMEASDNCVGGTETSCVRPAP